MIKVTPTTIRACYQLLAQLPPFSRWKLPRTKDIEFIATRATDCYGEYEPEHIVRVSSAKNGHLDTLLRTVAHEMIHMVRACRRDPNWEKHDEKFAAMAAQVSKNMGFDPKEL